MTNQPGEFSICTTVGLRRIPAASLYEPATENYWAFTNTATEPKIYLPTCSQIPKPLNHGFYFLSNLL